MYSMEGCGLCGALLVHLKQIYGFNEHNMVGVAFVGVVTQQQQVSNNNISN